MSPIELQVTAQKDDIVVTVSNPPPINIQAMSSPGMQVIVAGNIGPPGPQGQWVSMTQAEYDALVEVNPDTLYVIVG
jgi:hypothetical protein